MSYSFKKYFLMTYNVINCFGEWLLKINNSKAIASIFEE